MVQYCQIESSLICQHGNDPKHTLTALKAQLDRKTHSEPLSVMDWPPQRRKINIIEAVWDILYFHVFLNLSINCCTYLPFSQQNTKRKIRVSLRCLHSTVHPCFYENRAIYLKLIRWKISLQSDDFGTEEEKWTLPRNLVFHRNVFEMKYFPSTVQEEPTQGPI